METTRPRAGRTARKSRKRSLARKVHGEAPRDRRGADGHVVTAMFTAWLSPVAATLNG
jgi:hypothetical protein